MPADPTPPALDPPAWGAAFGLPPLARWALAWLAGIALGMRWPAPPAPALALAAAAVSGATCLALHRRLAANAPILRVLPALAFCLVLGALRGAAAIPDLSGDHIAAWLDDGPVVLRGTIARPPDRRDRRTDYLVAVEAVRSAERRAVGPGGPGGSIGHIGPRSPMGPIGHIGPSSPDPDPIAWSPAHGLVLAQASRFPSRAVGDRVLVTGTLEAAPDGPGFDYRAYLAQHDIHALMSRPAITALPGAPRHPVRRALEAIRDRARDVLNDALPEPAASLAVGILLGDDRGIPRPLDEAFQTTGTTHVIAISGSNIALLVAVLAFSLGRLLGRRRAAPVTMAVVALYTVLVGADAAVVRAALMGGVLVLGDALGRPTHAPTALLAAAWAMTAWHPAVLGDLGFQLSFAATAGLVAFARPLTTTVDGALAAHGLARGRSALRVLQEPLLVTVAAQLTTWPLIAVRTGQLSVVSLAANLLIVPVQPLVMALGGLTAVAGAVWAPAGRALGAVAWLPLAWTIAVVERAARVPYAAVELVLPVAVAAAYYAALLGLAGGRARARGALNALRSAARDGRAVVQGLKVWGRQGNDPAVDPTVDRNALDAATLRERALAVGRSLAEAGQGGRADASRAGGLREILGAWRVPAALVRLARATAWLARGWPGAAAAVALAVLVWSAVVHQPDGLLHLHVLDVGQGDALLVVTPTGRRMLIDGGPSPSAVLSELGHRLPPWDRRLDIVVLTHPDADHIGGLAAVLRRYRVGWVIDPAVPHFTAEAAEYEAAVADEVGAGARRVRGTTGLRLVLDAAAGVEAEALWPPEPPPRADASVNDRSIVLRVVHGRTSFLLTGDIEEPVEEHLVAANAPLRADVLKVPHHGSDTSSTPPFVAAVRPSLALISAGVDNPFGHPTSGALERLAGAQIRRTDLEGAIEVIGDGAGLWVKGRGR